MTKQTTKITDDLKNLEYEWSAAEVRGDRDALKSILTDDFVGIGPRGFVLSKSEWLDRHASGDLSYTSITVDDVTVHPYGDAALVTCVQSQKGSYQSHDIDGSFRASQMVVRDGDRWRVASLQLSPMMGAPTWVTSESAS
jgi:ketosteroid isomerase-like protein